MFPSASLPASFNDATPATALATSGAVNEADYEGYGYDPNGNRTSKRLRDGQSIAYSYDALNRLTAKDLPNIAAWEYDLAYTYDLLGRMLTASNTNTLTLSFGWDGFGRLVSEGNNHFSANTYQYDAAGRRTRMTWRDGFFVQYDHLDTGELVAARENGVASGACTGAAACVLATLGYDDLGRRTSLTRGNGTSTSYDYDGAWDGSRRLGRAGLSGAAHVTRSGRRAGIAQW